MNERRISTMPSHNLMPRSIPRRMGLNRCRIVHQRVDGDVSRHTVKNPSGVKHEPKHFNEYIGPVDVIPGEPLLVIAELRGVIAIKEFVPQPAKTPEDTLVLAAKARIGLNQEGFFAVLAGSHSLRMRVGNTGGLLQEVTVEMPPYDPNKLVAEYKNSLIIASAS